MDFKVGDKVMQVPVIPKESVYNNTWHKSLTGMIGIVVFPLGSRREYPEHIGVKFERPVKDSMDGSLTHTFYGNISEPLGRNFREHDLTKVPEKFESISYERLYE